MNVVQIGTCKANDHLPQWVKSHDVDLVVLVEPMRVHYEDIMKAYEGTNYAILGCAAVELPTNEFMSFFYHKNDGPNYEVASTSKQHILKHGLSEEGIVELKVPCKTMNEIFEMYDMNVVHYLFIDAEGLDEVLIKSIDFEKYDIKQIYFEGLHINVDSTVEFLRSKGFSTEVGVGSNGWDCLSTKQ